MRHVHDLHSAAPVPSRARSSKDRLLARARGLAHGSAARLRRAAARAGGEDGLAMASALVDMILHREPPAGWPVADMIALFDSTSVARDRQVERLVASLRALEADIALWMSEGAEMADMDDQERAA